MKKTLRLWYVFFPLLGFYVLLQIVPAIQVLEPWQGCLKKHEYVFVLAMLLVLAYECSQRLSELKSAMERARDAEEKLGRLLERVNSLAEETRQLESEVNSIRQDIRLSDALMHGKILFYEQQYEEAAEVFKEVVKTDSEAPDNNYWLGISLLRNRNAHGAVGYLQKAVEAAPHPPAEYFKALGEAEFRLNRPGPAESHLQQALDAGIRNVEEVLLLKCKAALRNDPKRGKTSMLEFVRSHPYNGNAIKDFAEFLVYEKDYDQAIAICNSGLNTHEGNWILYPRRAEALLLRHAPGDREQAAKDLAQARKANRQDYSIYRVEGEDYLKQALAAKEGAGRSEMLRKAIGVFEEGTSEAMPDRGYRAPLFERLSYAYLLIGDPDDAVKAAKGAVADYSRHINNHLALCAALLAARQYAALRGATCKAKTVGKEAGRIYSCAYEILAALGLGEGRDGLRGPLQNLVKEVEGYPKFQPNREDLRQALMLSPIKNLAGDDCDLASTITSYLGGQGKREVFLAGLRRFCA
jgi:tetratricopeptide (TPR) repeat protein